MNTNRKNYKRAVWSISLLLLLAIGLPVRAQKAVVKTNALYLATATPNATLEMATGRKHSLALTAGFQPWQYSDTKKLKHWLVQPEFRYWPCETFMGHFFGIHALGGQFNAGGIKLPFGIFPSLEDSRYQGWAAGAGLSWGYQWLLSKRWSLEVSLGLGYIYVDYKKYACATCGTAQKKDHKHYVGPTKAAVSLVYVIK